MSTNNQKGFANIVLIVLVVILVGAVGYFAFVKKSAPVVEQSSLTQTSTSTQVSNSETANWKTYMNDQYGFEIKYPVTVKFYEEPQDPKERPLPQCSSVVNNIGCFLYAPGKTARYSTFDSAVLGINIDSSLSSESKCNASAMYLDYSGKPLPKKNVNINGITFSEIETGVAATGQRAKIYVYSVFYKGDCVQLPISINYGRNNYSVGDSAYQPTEGETEADIDSAQKILSQLLATFKFTR